MTILASESGVGKVGFKFTSVVKFKWPRLAPS